MTFRRERGRCQAAATTRELPLFLSLAPARGSATFVVRGRQPGLAWQAGWALAGGIGSGAGFLLLPKPPSWVTRAAEAWVAQRRHPCKPPDPDLELGEAGGLCGLSFACFAGSFLGEPWGDRALLSAWVSGCPRPGRVLLWGWGRRCTARCGRAPPPLQAAGQAPPASLGLRPTLGLLPPWPPLFSGVSAPESPVRTLALASGPGLNLFSPETLNMVLCEQGHTPRFRVGGRARLRGPPLSLLLPR